MNDRKGKRSLTSPNRRPNATRPKPTNAAPAAKRTKIGLQNMNAHVLNRIIASNLQANDIVRLAATSKTLRQPAERALLTHNRFSRHIGPAVRELTGFFSKLQNVNRDIAVELSRGPSTMDRIKRVVKRKYEQLLNESVNAFKRANNHYYVPFRYDFRHGQGTNGRVIRFVRFGIDSDAFYVSITMAFDGPLVRYSKFEFEVDDTKVTITLPRNEGNVRTSTFATLNLERARITSRISYSGFPCSRYSEPFAAEHLVARYAILGEKWWASPMNDRDALRYLRILEHPLAYSTSVIEPLFGPSMAAAFRQGILRKTASVRERAMSMIRGKTVHVLFLHEPRIRESLRARAATGKPEIMTTVDVKRILEDMTTYDPIANRQNRKRRENLLDMLYTRLKSNSTYAGRPTPSRFEFPLPY